jgi:hypothetical protein
MQPKSLLLADTPGEEDKHNCASADEVAVALNGLTESDHAKLMIIAKGFCRSRRLPFNVIEPKELLGEAVKRTLSLEKKWVKSVSLLKHLDRAMENISGHLVLPSSKIVPFPDGVSPDEKAMRERQPKNDPGERLEQQERVQNLLEEIFGDDTQARDVFVSRVEGFSLEQIKSEFHLTDTGYESVAKRIRRKIATFLTN